MSVLAAQICREAGARVTTNVHVRDMDLAVFNNLDGRRLEVVADGLTLWHGAQLAIDTTLVSPLHRDGSARARATDHNGAVLVEARRRKETYPELSGEGGRARLVVLAAEVGGRWNEETATFLSALAKTKALESPLVLQGRVQAAYIRRDGVLCWHVLLPVPSRCPCWTVAQSMGQEQTSRQCMSVAGCPFFVGALFKCLLLCNFLGPTFPSHSAFLAKKNEICGKPTHHTGKQELDRCWSGTGLESPFSDSARSRGWS